MANGERLPEGADDALLPGGNRIHGSRNVRFRSMTVIPGSALTPAPPGRPSKAQARGTIRGHQGMPSSGKSVSKAQSRGLGKGHSPQG